jgi:multiple sugar transport system permease protein
LSRLLHVVAVAALLLISSAAFAAPKNVVLRFRYWGDFKEIRVLQTTIAEFEHDHPGITIKGERVNSGDEYIQKLLLEQAAGLTPDVMFVGTGYPILAKHGVLRDLSKDVAQDPTVPLSRYYPVTVKFFTQNNKLYALPRDIAPEGLVYYNKKLFDEAGVPYPDNSWRWDYAPHPERGDKDFLTATKKLTKIGVNGQSSTYGFADNSPEWVMGNFVYGVGGQFVDNTEKPTKLLYNDPKVVKAIQLTADMMYKYNVSPSAVDVAASGVDQHNLFAQGRVAMYMTGIWEVPKFREEIQNFDWDIAPFPAGPTGLRGVTTGGSGYGISATTQYPKESWELLKYIAGPIGLGNLAKAGLAQPAISSLANSRLWLDGKRPVNRKVTIEEVPYSHVDGIVFDPDWPQVNQIIEPKLQLVWNGTLTAQQAVDEFYGPAQRKLDELNHPPYHPLLNWWLGLLGLVLVVAALVGWVWMGARSDIRIGRKTGTRTEAWAGYAFISPWLIGAVVFLAAPMLISLLLAFCSWDMTLPATWVGFGNFKDMGADEEFWKSLFVTAMYTLFSVPLGIIGSLLLALLLNSKIRGQSVFRTLYYIPAVASTVAASLIWMRLFNPESGMINYVINFMHATPIFKALGLTDPVKGYVNWLGSEKTALASLIVMSIWGIGGGMVIYLAGLQGIPQAYYEAADIDGASVWQKFTNVTLPLLTPTIFFTTIMGVIASFQVFTQGFVMTQGGPNNATMFYVLYLYDNAFQFLKVGYASAMAWVLFLVILFFTVLQMRMSRWVHYEAEAK